MKKPDAVCPKCKNIDEVYKVSVIYLSGLESIKSSTPPEDNTFDNIFGQPSQQIGRRFIDQAAKRSLVSKFAPPSSEKQRIRRSIHPDYAMFATMLLALFMLYQIFIQQRGVFLPALLIILGVTAFYLLGRKKINARYMEKQRDRSQETRKIEEAIERWMSLYYCAADFAIFDEERLVSVPLQEMNHYLMTPETWLEQAEQEE